MNSNHPTNAKDVITRWPQINDKVQYSIVDGNGKKTGNWQPGLISAVCREKAQLTLTLYAVDYQDHDSGLSSGGVGGRILTVDYPGKPINSPSTLFTLLPLYKPNHNRNTNLNHTTNPNYTPNLYVQMPA